MRPAQSGWKAPAAFYLIFRRAATSGALLIELRSQINAAHANARANADTWAKSNSIDVNRHPGDPSAAGASLEIGTSHWALPTRSVGRRNRRGLLLSEGGDRDKKGNDGRYQALRDHFVAPRRSRSPKGGMRFASALMAARRRGPGSSLSAPAFYAVPDSFANRRSVIE